MTNDQILSPLALDVIPSSLSLSRVAVISSEDARHEPREGDHAAADDAEQSHWIHLAEKVWHIHWSCNYFCLIFYHMLVLLSMIHHVHCVVSDWS